METKKGIEEKSMWTLTEFLKETGGQIASQIAQRCRPRADSETIVHPAIADLLRRPLPSQSVVIHGLADYLLENDDAFTFAEMGSGKTLISLGILKLLKALKRAGSHNWIIVCPPHLVSTWIEEIQMTIAPDQVRTFQVGRIAKGDRKDKTAEVTWNGKEKKIDRIPGTDFSFSRMKDKAFRKKFETGDTLNLWILSRESLKLGAGWRKAVQRRRAPAEKTLAIETLPNSWRIGRENVNFSVLGGTIFASVPLPIGAGDSEIPPIYETNQFQTPRAWLEDLGYACFQSSEPIKIREWIRANLESKYQPKDFCPETGKWPTLNGKSREHIELVVKQRGHLTGFRKNTGKWIPTNSTSQGKTKTKYHPYWQYDEKGVRRWSLCDFICKFMKGWFNGVVFDEGHELNNIESAQGLAGLRLSQACGKSLTLTGTATNGTSEALWSSFFRCDSREMEDLGFGYPTDDTGNEGRRHFAETYGVVERITQIEKTENRTSKATHRTQRKLIPGIMPGIHTLELNGQVFVERSAFVTLDMISQNLPARTYETILVDQDEELRCRGEIIKQDFASFVAKWEEEYGRRPYVLMPMTLTSHLDAPDHPVRTTFDDCVIVDLPGLEKERLYPKEIKYLEFLREEIAQNRQVLTFVNYVNKGVLERLSWLLEREGIVFASLLSDDVPARDRKSWFEKLGAVDTVLVNPSCIQTGLTLLDYPTICVYQSGTNIITGKQSEARSYRIGAKKDVKIVYFAYRGTVQEITLSIMGKRRAALDAFQGIFTADMAMIGDGNLSMVELGRMLVENKNIEDAANIWKQLSFQGAKKKVSSLWEGLDAQFVQHNGVNKFRSVTEKEVLTLSKPRLF